MAECSVFVWARPQTWAHGLFRVHRYHLELSKRDLQTTLDRFTNVVWRSVISGVWALQTLALIDHLMWIPCVFSPGVGFCNAHVGHWSIWWCVLAAHVHVYNMHVCASILNGMCSSGKDVFYICRVNNHLDFGKGFNELMENQIYLQKDFAIHRVQLQFH